MKKLILAGFIATLVSCANTNDFDAELDAKVSKPADPSTATTQEQVTPGRPVPLSNPNPTPTVVSTTPVTTAPVITTSQPATTTAAGMNPPHGQPGHRCDISVGAPLNSAPAQAKPATTTTTTTPAPQNINMFPKPNVQTSTAPAQPVAPGMNPAHGQPGHRCDIAVGAPLNSAPAKKEEAKKEETAPAPATDSSRN